MKPLLLLFFSLPALAAPPCWTLDGSEVGPNRDGLRIADGQFLVSLSIEEATKDDLVQMMKKAKFGNIQPSAYPTIFDDLIVFQLEAVTENTERPELIEAVNGQIDEIQSIGGVKEIGCNNVTGFSPFGT